MKRLLFFIAIIIFCFSCKNKQLQTSVPEKKENSENALLIKKEEALKVDYNDTVNMPSLSDPYFDSGYFKGYISDTLTDFGYYEDTSELYSTFYRMIKKDELKLLLYKTPSHSVFIDQKKKLRIDSFITTGLKIISKYSFKDHKQGQKIYLNGRNIYNSTLKSEYGFGEDEFDIDEHSFRYFSFHGEPFYYFEAGAFYTAGASMGNVTYFIIYNIKHKKLSYFSSCRVRHSSFLIGNVNNDDALDFVEFDNSEFCTGVPNSDNFICRLYSCNSKGEFVLQKDKQGKTYFINARSGEGFMQDSFIVKSSYWPVPIK